MTNATAELFETLVGQNITVTTVSGTELWHLTGVKRHDVHSLRSDQPFNLYLSAPASNAREQGLRAFALPGGESLEFFAVPISATADSVAYEVIFN